MPNWTAAQRQAIEARNKELLVTAAAGSGKTAVLVERILTLIRKDGLDVGRMLIVTFTRAAAAEMRERISKALQEAADTEEKLRDQALKVERASISTLHVFCGQVLRDHFQAAGVDPTARLVEGGEQDAIYRQALAEVLLAAHEEGKPGFTELSLEFEDETIAQMADSLYGFIMSLPAPWRWMHQRMADFPAAQELPGHPWMKQLTSDLQLQLEGCLSAARELLSVLDDPDADISYEGMLQEDIRQIELLEKALQSGIDQLKEAWENAQFPRFAAIKGKSPETVAWGENLKERRQKIRDGIRAIIKAAPGDLEKAAEDIAHTKPALRALCRLVHKLHLRYDILKREKNVYDFHDLEHKTLAALSVPEVREAVRQKFDAVFIDEYQDISGIQEAILQAVHGDNYLFLVGDVKQSIYRFRLADPTLFLKKSKEASLNEDAVFRRIPLQENFRSAKSVLDGVNAVFESVMRSDVTEIDYDEEARLIPGRKPEGEAPVELHVLIPAGDAEPEEEESDPSEAQEAPSRVEKEARRAAACMRRLRDEQFPDRETGKMRPFKWRDMAVLLPKAKNVARLVAQTLSEEGIPVYSEADEEYFGLPEIATMMALLQTLDNPMQDISLLTTLRSPCFNLGEETLSAIRLAKTGRNIPFHAAFFCCAQEKGPLGESCASITNKLDNWRFLSRSLPLDKLIWQLLSDTGLYTRSGALPAGAARQANLRLLCERAAAYETSAGEGLSGFLSYGEDLKKSGDAVTAKVLGENEDVVRIMTIHKSKGLEFPAVVVMDLGGRFRGSAQDSPMKIHRELGISIPCIHPDARTRRKTLSDQSIGLALQGEDKAERARLLYVAMTRSRERLILIGTAAGKDPAARWAMAPGAYRVWQAKSMLDWIAQAVYPQEAAQPLRALNGEFSTDSAEDLAEYAEKCTSSTGFPQSETPWKIQVWAETGLGTVEKNVDVHTQASQLANLENRLIPEGVAWRMDAGSSGEKHRLPLKTSVTSLCKQRLLPGYLPGEGEETPETKAKPEEWTLPLRLSPLPARPSFLERKALTAADLGSATHKALGCLTLEPLREKTGEALRLAVREGLGELTEKGLLTREQREGIYEEWIVGFYESVWGQRLLDAQESRREWAFNLLYSREPMTLLQGVIDCCFIEDGAWVLLDYKTDFVKDERAIFERYQPQLLLYKQALEEITGIPVREAVLYLLRKASGKALPKGSALGNPAKGTSPFGIPC